MDFPRELYVVIDHLRARQGARTVLLRLRHESGDDVSLVELKIRDNTEHMRALNFLTDWHDEIIASFDWDRVRVRALFESAGFTLL